MKDSRGSRAKVEDSERVYPCLKCYSTINAPFENVCQYLSNSNHVPEYNDLLTQHRDLEEISENSKVCWAMTPQASNYVNVWNSPTSSVQLISKTFTCWAMTPQASNYVNVWNSPTSSVQLISKTFTCWA